MLLALLCTWNLAVTAADDPIAYWTSALSPDGTLIAGSISQIGQEESKIVYRQSLSFVKDRISNDFILLINSSQPDVWVTSLAFSPDGKWLALGASGGEVKTIKVRTKTPGLSLKPGPSADITGLSFSADGKRLLVGSHKFAAVYDAQSGKLLGKFTQHGDWVFGGQFAGPSTMMTWGSDDRVRVWALNTGKQIASFPGRFAGLSSAGRAIALTGDGQINAYVLATGAKAKSVAKGQPMRYGAVSPGGAYAALSSANDSSVEVFNLSTGKPAFTISARQDQIMGMSISLGNLLVITYANNGPLLYDIKSGRQVR
jgi:WD40 repeat protein